MCLSTVSPGNGIYLSPYTVCIHYCNKTASTLHTLHSILYTPYSTLHTLHSILYTLYSTLYTLHSILYIVQLAQVIPLQIFLILNISNDCTVKCIAVVDRAI